MTIENKVETKKVNKKSNSGNGLKSFRKGAIELARESLALTAIIGFFAGMIYLTNNLSSTKEIREETIYKGKKVYLTHTINKKTKEEMGNYELTIIDSTGALNTIDNEKDGIINYNIIKLQKSIYKTNEPDILSNCNADSLEHITNYVLKNN